MITYDNSTQRNEYDLTYQVYNSGRGVARNVKVSIDGQPSDSFKVNKTYVYVGEPLESNLLAVVNNNYEIGILGAGKSYTFRFFVQIFQPSGAGNYTIIVDSENAGKHLMYYYFNSLLLSLNLYVSQKLNNTRLT